MVIYVGKETNFLTFHPSQV